MKRIKRERSILDEMADMSKEKTGNYLLARLMVYRIFRFLHFCGPWAGFGKN